MTRPSVDKWIEEARADKSSADCGMYLFHNGIVRQTPKAKVRNLTDEASAADAEKTVAGMYFSYDREKVRAIEEETLRMPGVYYARIWLNEGNLSVGDDIMLVLVGGDIRPHVTDALQYLVGRIKNECVSEKEIYAE